MERNIDMNRFSKPTTPIKQYMKTLMRGFLKTMYGTLTTAFFAEAVYVFTLIPSEGGYTAVCAFMVAILMLVLACRAMYAFGCRRGKREYYAAEK